MGKGEICWDKTKHLWAKRTPPKPWNINNNAAFVKLWSRSEIFWKKWKEINEILCLMLQKRKFWIDEEVRTGRQPSRLCGYWQRFFLQKGMFIRSFFSLSFEPASYSLVGRLILNPNQPMILFNLLGLQRNLSKFEMNLPEIYLFSSPLLCLRVIFFCFVLFWKYQQIFCSIRTETHLFHWNIFHLLLFRISTLYRLRM